ncbi:MAG TPA: prepilin-type N-terminal cleavage/methylation domain-containing protein [Gemmatimonadaceae bacterium]|jgi:Tfp pilus assembly protein PilV|nr:prepilin-type N-terminal cleavage/methylation domain-containing protein [Gemmatimonadaceae bacterium]
MRDAFSGNPNKEGFSLVEVLTAMILLGLTTMSLAGAAALGLNQMGKARQDLQYSADVQQVADSLISVGYNNVANGSATLRGRAVTWTVANPNPNTQRVDIVAQRRGQANTTLIYRDTVTLFLSKTRIQ